LSNHGQENSNTIKASLLYGITLSKQKKYDKAIELLEEPLKLVNLNSEEVTPLTLEAYYELGLCYDAVNRFTESFKCLEAVEKHCKEIWDKEMIETLNEKLTQIVK
jgi:tetratricopeptide (TPR) repeat protein